MNDATIGLDMTEETILINEVSDSALEAAAGTGREETAGKFTILCTTSNCDGVGRPVS